MVVCTLRQKICNIAKKKKKSDVFTFEPLASITWRIGRQNNLVNLEIDRPLLPISGPSTEIVSLQWPRD